MKTKLLIIFSAASLAACSSPKDEFVEGCVETSVGVPGAERICECTYSKLEEKYGKEKMNQIDGNPVNLAWLPDDFMDSNFEFTLQCMQGK